MSAPKTIYVELNRNSKFFRFMATLEGYLLDGDYIYFPIDEDMPVYKLMDFIAGIK